MPEQVKSILDKITSFMPDLGKNKKFLPIWVIYVFAFIYLLLLVLFVVAWIDDWGVSHKPNLPILITFIQTMAGATVILSFICKYLVDVDKDGIPDEIEKEDHVQ